MNRAPHNPMTDSWTPVRTEHILHTPAFDVHKVQLEAPRSPETRDYYHLATGDWVNIIALTPAQDLVMIRQWRHGAGILTLEFPGGRVDPDEEPEDAAVRELLEETGYQAGAVHSLSSMHPNPALQNNRAHSFLAENCRKIQDVQNDPGEKTLPVLVPQAEIPEKIRNGEITHALMLAALALWSVKTP